MTFLDYLKANKEKEIYVDPCSGNNGDDLIWQGMLEALKKQDIQSTNTPEEADVIIINGGGMFIDAYSQGIGKITEYSNYFPEKELCIAPNSYFFTQVDFKSVLSSRAAKLVLFVREKYSLAYLEEVVKGLSHVSIHLDHDLAFHLDGSEFISTIREKYKVKKGHVLVVDRMDLEHSKNKGNASLIKKIYTSCVPEAIKKVVRVIRKERRNSIGTEFTARAKQLIKNENPEYQFENIVTMDISRPDICDFEGFKKLIAESEYIFTNRLHVGVLGHLLERNVYMREGSYHKMTGIYELSMQDRKTTSIFDDA